MKDLDIFGAFMTLLALAFSALLIADLCDWPTAPVFVVLLVATVACVALVP